MSKWQRKLAEEPDRLESRWALTSSTGTSEVSGLSPATLAPLTSILRDREELHELSSPILGQPVLTARDAPWTLAQIHERTGVALAHRDFHLDGAGQTVAVIDSGIAYDHVALGGGLGQSYRVVGGRDFTEEQDDNPYDDAPAGFHGTHVSGILASSDSVRQGVAPAVDLVALRVFNDRGRGKLEWVEQALQWVLDHRLDFSHPITTVNLSLGTSWNGTTLPDYASLENEFAALREQGIFVAVAAGNRFNSQSIGLSYPAVSPEVYVAASLGFDGAISPYSQRSKDSFLVPGQQIESTVPDFVHSFDGIPNDYYVASGTSMAAPYLAGSSVLIRQALARVQGIPEDQVSLAGINEALRAGSLAVNDPVSHLSIPQLNVGESVRYAFQQMSPSVESSPAPPSFVSWSDDVLHIHGSTADDQMEFQRDGTIVVNGLGYTVDLRAVRRIEIVGGGGDDALKLTSDVANTYVSLKPNSVQLSRVGLQFIGDGFTRIEVDGTGNNGMSASFYGSSGADSFVVNSESASLQGTNDFGSSFHNSAVGVQHVSGWSTDPFDRALIVTTPSTDEVIARPSSVKIVTSNRSIQAYGFASLQVEDLGGADRATLFGSSAPDVLRASDRRTWIRGSEYFYAFVGIESIQAWGRGGNDTARLTGSDEGDQWYSDGQTSEFSTPTSRWVLRDFVRSDVQGGKGYDRVQLKGSPNDDLLSVASVVGWFLEDSKQASFAGFEQFDVRGGGGADLARIQANHDFLFHMQSESVDRDEFNPLFVSQGRVRIDLTEFARVVAAEDVRSENSTIRDRSVAELDDLLDVSATIELIV